MKRLLLIAALAAALSLLVALLFYTQFTVFVVQPIGAIPEGKTLILKRTTRLHFIDSADAVCKRETGSVNLLCRGVVLAAVAKNDMVVGRLPCSETLYLVSTGGVKYDR
jgi:hypothetical protein